MRPVFNNQPAPEKRVDFGDAIISNAKYDCTKCLLKAEGCKFICNSINCTVAIKRMNKILDDNRDAKVEESSQQIDKSLEEEEKQSLKDYLNSLSSEDSSDEEDD